MNELASKHEVYVFFLVKGDTNLLMDDWIALQCDGTVFVLKRAVITPGSLLDVMFVANGGAHSSQCARNESHPLRPYLFDRCAKYVEPVINFLRTGELVIDSGISRRGVLLEASYFGIDEVSRALRGTEIEFDAYEEIDCADTVVSPQKQRLEKACCSRQELLASIRGLPMDSGLRLRGMCLNRISFAKLDLRNANFEHCSLIECDFSFSDLSKCQMSYANASRSSFTKALITHAICLDTNFEDCSFENASCQDSNFTGSKMIGLRASQCDFSRSVLIKCDLSRADLRGTILHQTQMRHVKLEGVERSGTNISMGGVIA